MKLENEQGKWICPCCGKAFSAIPLTFGIDFPDYLLDIPEGEWENRVLRTESLCVIDEKHFFHRCRMSIPIHDYADVLNFNVWCSISEANFRKRMDFWESPQRAFQEPYFGWFANQLDVFGKTLNLKCLAQETGPGTIPSLEVVEEGHPLQLAQRQGITLGRASEIVGELLRDSHGG